MTKKLHYLILGSSTIFIILILFSNISFNCLFESLFGIECGTCGLTRGFNEILRLNFFKATQYNLFSIPVFIGVTIYYLISISDLVLKKDNIFKLYDAVIKYQVVIYICYFISLLYNNI